jgi:hypothetical protein
MNRTDRPDPRLGDHVEMRKPHPCGSREWVVYRVGGDIGVRCAGCDHRLMMSRSTFNRSVKRLWQVPAVEGGSP